MWVKAKVKVPSQQEGLKCVIQEEEEYNHQGSAKYNGQHLRGIYAHGVLLVIDHKCSNQCSHIDES